MIAKWFRSYGLMLKWVFLSNRSWNIFNLFVQVAISVGFVIGIGYFYPQMTPTIAKYLTTGSPTIGLLLIGLVALPSMVANMRLTGTFDYVWSLPVPRMAYIAADATNTFGMMIPGVVLSIILGKFHFGFDLQVSWLVIPAVLLIASCATFTGYGLAFAVPRPMMVNVITQVITFLVTMFSPVMYPSSQLPSWLQAVHQVLPIQYMADLMRGTLTDIPVKLGMAFSMVGAWFVAGFVCTYFLVKRRH